LGEPADIVNGVVMGLFQNWLLLRLQDTLFGSSQIVNCDWTVIRTSS
jgi:hypothetical protein